MIDWKEKERLKKETELTSIVVLLITKWSDAVLQKSSDADTVRTTFESWSMWGSWTCAPTTILTDWPRTAFCFGYSCLSPYLLGDVNLLWQSWVKFQLENSPDKTRTDILESCCSPSVLLLWWTPMGPWDVFLCRLDVECPLARTMGQYFISIHILDSPTDHTFDGKRQRAVKNLRWNSAGQHPINYVPPSLSSHSQNTRRINTFN